MQNAIAGVEDFVFTIEAPLNNQQCSWLMPFDGMDSESVMRLRFRRLYVCMFVCLLCVFMCAHAWRGFSITLLRVTRTLY